MANRLFTLFEYLRIRGIFDKARQYDDDDRTVPIEEISTHFGYSDKETIALLEALSCCGDSCLLVPLAISDDGRSVEAFTSFTIAIRPLRLSVAERLALIEAYAMTGAMQGDTLYDKLLQGMVPTSELSSLTDKPSTDTATAYAHSAEVHKGRENISEAATAHDVEVLKIRELLIVLFEAIEEQQVVHLNHARRDDGSLSERDVEPLELTLENGRWYLNAYCRLREEERSFALSSIQSAVNTGVPFVKRNIEFQSIAAYLQDGLPLAYLRFKADTLVEKRDWPGVRLMPPRADGSREATVPYLESSWLPTRILSHFDMVEVLEPQSLKDEVARLARKRSAQAQQIIKQWNEGLSTGKLCLLPHPLFPADGGCSKEALEEIVSHSFL